LHNSRNWLQVNVERTTVPATKTLQHKASYWKTGNIKNVIIHYQCQSVNYSTVLFIVIKSWKVWSSKLQKYYISSISKEQWWRTSFEGVFEGRRSRDQAT